jgi:DNA-directed RNA polymerase specialized sigma subunit
MNIKQQLKELHVINLLIAALYETIERDRRESAYYQDDSYLYEEIKELEERKQATLTLISELDDERQKAVLIERYLNGSKWEEVATAVNYSRNTVFRIHRQALKQLEGEHG